MHEVSEICYYEEDSATYEQCQYDRSWDVFGRIDSIFRECSQGIEPEEAVACSCSSGHRIAEINVRVVEWRERCKCAFSHTLGYSFDSEDKECYYDNDLDRNHDEVDLASYFYAYDIDQRCYNDEADEPYP